MDIEAMMNSLKDAHTIIQHVMSWANETKRENKKLQEENIRLKQENFTLKKQLVARGSLFVKKNQELDS